MNKQSLTHKTHVIANNTGLPFNTVLTHYFLEIVLSRIAASDGSKHYIFKEESAERGYSSFESGT